MSVATELVPEVFIPERARTRRPPGSLATVHVLRSPAAEASAPQLRLTVRGRWVIAGLVAAVALAILAIGASSHPDARAVTGSAPAPAVVTVHVGDTLWSIARRVAPGVDPWVEVAELRRRNGLDGVSLRPGQLVRVPPPA